MKASLPAVWFIGLDAEKKEAFKQILLNNTTLIQRFMTILDDYSRQIEDEETKDEMYETPEAYARQVFLNGRKRQLKDIKRLFEFV